MTAPVEVDSHVLKVMDAVETLARRIGGLQAVTPTVGAITPPCLIVGAPDVPTYRAGLGVRPTWTFALTVLTSAAFDREGQRLLASYADHRGDHSVPALFRRDPTLGGLVEDAHVTSFRVLGLEEVGAIGYFGGVFTLSVMVH